jgi:hypothetical protein
VNITRRTCFGAALCTTIAMSVGRPTPAAADEAAELVQLKADVEADRKALADERAALDEQRRRIDEALLKLQDTSSQQKPIDLPPPPAAAPAKPASEAHLDAYGFIHTDGIYDFKRVDPAWNATLRSSKIPVTCPGDAGCGQHGETILSVRQSRLGFKGYLPTELGELKTWFEFDLFGVGVDAGNTTMRIRHVWAELGQWGAGQTNSLFMDGDLFPNTIDYWGPTGMVFLRNPQVRWTPVKSESMKLGVALEAPGAGIDAGKAALIDPTLQAKPWNLLPDFTAQFRYTGSWGHVQVSGILRDLGVEGTVANAQAHRHTVGWGGNLGHVLELGSFTDFLRGDQLLAGIVFGYGIANYMNDGGNDIAPTMALRPAAVPSLGWTAYYNRTWNEYFTSSVGYSQHRQFNLDGQTATSFTQADYFNVNLLWHPVHQMFVGPEFIWGKRKNKDSQSGTDSRVQISFHYDFGGRIGPP